MDWKKFKDEVPKEKTEVLIALGDKYYVATYDKNTESFCYFDGNGRRNCWRNNIVYWTNINEPKEITEEKEKNEKQ